MTLEHIRFLKTRMGLGADASDIMSVLNLAEERLLLEQLSVSTLIQWDGTTYGVDDARGRIHNAPTLGEAIRKAAEVSYAR